MLIEILRALDQFGYVDLKQLSRTINIPATAIVGAFQQLNNRGYLKKQVVASHDCSCCPLTINCRSVSTESSEHRKKMTVYSLTPKGIQFLERVKS
ncbi:MAG: hypothetical protein ACTSYO_02795 [Candidatus Ranarchaeia archaeon]